MQRLRATCVVKKCNQKSTHREKLAHGQTTQDGGGGKVDLWVTDIGTNWAAAMWNGHRVGVTKAMGVIPWPRCGEVLGLGLSGSPRAACVWVHVSGRRRRRRLTGGLRGGVTGGGFGGLAKTAVRGRGRGAKWQ